MKNKSVRLSEHIRPIKYNITIKPDLEGFVFEGQEEILLEVKKATAKVVLHAKNLEIDNVSIATSPRPSPQEGRESEIWAKKIDYDEKAETAGFEFGKSLKPGKYRLKLAFKGVLNDHMRGFYRSGYSHGGKQKHLAVTQFEATDARQAFPCFDEPAHKAVFEINMIVPKNLSAISNTEPISITDYPHPTLSQMERGENDSGERGDESGYKLVRFEATPKMSSYLAALIVGELENVEGKTRHGVIVRVHTTPGKKQQGKFALDCAIKCLEFYNEYFGIPYPLRTLDMIAIPDFAHGAMENWGAVTYRESALLVDEENSAAANKQWIALVVAHELAHQWFGNLVTMEWWTHLWLNEGFASYIEYLAVNELFPKWDIWTQFAYNDLGVALRLDALASTHPIEVEVHHPNEIGEIFDEVSYSKGSSVIRMLADYLGPTDFRDGLRYYLKKHSFSNASTESLWKAFEIVSKKPVRKMMRDWTGKGGYPLVSVDIAKEDKKTLALDCSQKRFFSSAAQKSTDKTLWHIPFSAQSSGHINPGKYLLGVKNRKFKTLTLTLSQRERGVNSWIKINAGETGFFRTQYDPNLLTRLAEPVKKKILAPIDRLGLIRDLFALAQAGKISAAEALSFCANYIYEDDYTVWVEIATGINTIENLIYAEGFYQEYKNFAGGLFEKIAKKVGWEEAKNQKHTDILLRSLVLSQAGSFGNNQVIGKAKQLFQKGKIRPDIRGVVYSLAVENGGQAEQKIIMSLYAKETLHEERNRLGRALGKFTDKSLLQKSLDFFMSKQVRPQDTPMFMAAAFANNHGRKQTWEFTKKNWPVLLKRYGHGGHLLGRFIKPLGDFNTEKEFADVKKFFKIHAHPGADRTVAQTLEQIRSNILWLKRDGTKINKFLNQV